MASPLVVDVVEHSKALATRAAEIFLMHKPRSLALAGGETPRYTYQVLAESAHPWARTDVFLTDERWVSKDNPHSNGGMIEGLLGKTGARLHSFEFGTTPELSASNYNDEIDRFLPIDFAFLGLGADGHTASLFPGDPACLVTDRWCVSTEAHFGHRRMTLTFAALARVRHAVFLVDGATKRDALKRLLPRADITIPAARVRPLETISILATRSALVSDQFD